MTDRDPKPIANIPPFGLRMQPELKESVMRAARANGRSLNAEIVSRLENGGLDRGEDGSFRIWLPPELLERVLDRARREETDPNEYFVDAVQKAFPPPPTLEGTLKSLADEIAFKPGKKSVQEQHFVQFVEQLLANAAKPIENAWRRKK